MRRKLGEISSYESVLCLCVVMIHVLSDSINGYPKGSVLSAISFIFSKSLTFVVPAFVMSSGIKFAHLYSEGNFNYFLFLRRRITKIYIPYLLVATAYYLYFVFHRNYFSFNLQELIGHLTLGTIAAPFYFVIIIMQLYILAPLTLNFCKNITPLFGILLAGIITIFSKYLMAGFLYSDRIFLGFLIYWIIGCYIGINFDMTIDRIKSSKMYIIVLGILLTIIYSIVSYLEFINLFTSFYTEILKIIFAAFASVMWLIIMPKYEHEGADIIAPATYYIYLIHCLVIFETEHLMEKWGITSTPQRFFITFIFAYLISIILSVLYAHTKNLIISKIHQLKN